MFGNRTKHSILSACVHWEFKNSNNNNNKLIFSQQHEMLSKYMSTDAFGRNIIHLEFDEFIKLNKDSPESETYVSLTKKGRDAYMSRYFLEKNLELFTKRFIDIGLLICNVGVLVVAIITIGNDNGERLKQIEHRVSLIESKLSAPIEKKDTNSNKQINKTIPDTKKILSPTKDTPSH